MALLDGKFSVGPSGPRTAALLARCALEEWLDEKSESWASSTYPHPTTASKLIALEVLGKGETGSRARRLWNSLSRAVHHHAYELQPSSIEVRQLVEQVSSLDDPETTANQQT